MAVGEESVLQGEGDGDGLCSQNMDHRENEDIRRWKMETEQVAHLVSEEKLSIFMRRKIFLMKNIQAENPTVQ